MEPSQNLVFSIIEKIQSSKLLIANLLLLLLIVKNQSLSFLSL